MIDPALERRLALVLRSRDARTRAAAIGELFEALRRPLSALCLRITCDPGDAEDALQEAAVDALRGCTAFRGDAKLSTWLWRIALRAALRIRARRRRPRAERAELDPDDLVHPEVEPAERLAAREEAKRLLAALGRLPAAQRVVLALAALDSLPQTEIAEVLGIPVGTVYSRLHGARERLARELER